MDQTRYRKTYSFFRQAPVYATMGGDGSQGPQGPQGPQGAQGPQGDCCDFFTINDPYAKTTSSVSFDSDFKYPYEYGSDVFFYVSGSSDGTGRSVFGGDVVISGALNVSNAVSIGGTQNLPVYGNVPGVVDAYFFKSYNYAFPGSAYQPYGSLFPNLQGTERGHLGNDGNLNKIWFNSTGTLHAFELVAPTISGSLQTLDDGVTPYLVAGPNITITTQSNGSVEITGSFGSIFTTSGTEAKTTYSVSFGGDYPSVVGSDVAFIVSGGITNSTSSVSMSLFSGDVKTSGSLTLVNGGSVSSYSRLVSLSGLTPSSNTSDLENSIGQSGIDLGDADSIHSLSADITSLSNTSGYTLFKHSKCVIKVLSGTPTIVHNNTIDYASTMTGSSDVNWTLSGNVLNLRVYNSSSSESVKTVAAITHTRLL